MNDAHLAGTYHVANDEATTWHEFALAIFEAAALRGLPTPRTVRRLTTAEYPTRAVRPANSVLACGKFERAFNLTLRSWRTPLEDVLDALTAPARATASG
jgi:dTDP-4-dehydrorhamnose reductase